MSINNIIKASSYIKDGGRRNSAILAKNKKASKARAKARAIKDAEKKKADEEANKKKEMEEKLKEAEEKLKEESKKRDEEKQKKDADKAKKKEKEDKEFEEKSVERNKELVEIKSKIKDKEEVVKELKEIAKETGEQPATLDNIKDTEDEISTLKDRIFELEKPDIEKAAEERHESRKDDKIKNEKLEELNKEIIDLKRKQKAKNDENAAENENLKTDSGLSVEEYEKLIEEHNKESEELKKLNNEFAQLKGKIIDKEFLEKVGLDLLTDKDKEIRKENNDEINMQIKVIEPKIKEVNNKIKDIEEKLGYTSSIIDTIKNKLGFKKSLQEIAIKKEINKLEFENLNTQVWIDYINKKFYNIIKSDDKKLKKYQEELKKRTDKVEDNVKKIKEYENKLDELKELRKEIDIKLKSRKEIADIDKKNTLDKAKEAIGISVDKRDISKAEKQIEKLEKEKKKLLDENIKYEAELKEAEATIGEDRKDDDKNNEEELEKLDVEINKLNDKLETDSSALKPSEKKKIKADIKILKIKKEKFKSSTSKKISKASEKIGRKILTSLKLPQEYKKLIEKNKERIKEIDDKILKLKEGKPVDKGITDILSKGFIGDVKNFMKKGEINKDSFKVKSMKKAELAAKEAVAKEQADKEKLKQEIANTKKPILDVQPKAENKKKGPAQVYEFDYHERITKPIYYKFYPVLSLILYVMVLAILSISIINIIIYFVLYVYDLIRLIFNDDVIQYNTVTYKTVLNYLESSEADYSNENFYIFTEQYVAYKNIDFFYMGFLSLFIPFIVYGLLLIFYKIKGENYAVIGGIRFQPLVFRILLVAVAHSVAHTYIYKYLFGSVIYLEFKKVKEQANTLDEFMKSNLNGTNIKNFYELLENGNIDVINSDINSHLESGDLDSAKKKIFTYIFYRYFTDIIEASRKEDRVLLRKYLTKEVGNDHLLTFFGLLNYKKKIVKKYYTDLNFYEEYALKNTAVASLKNMLDEQIDFVNKQLVNQKSYNSPYLFIAVYLLVIFIINFIFAGVMTYLIINDKSAPEDSIFPEAFTKLILDFTNYVYYNIQYFIYNIIGFK